MSIDNAIGYNKQLASNKRKADLTGTSMWGKLDFTKTELAEVHARIANEGLHLNRLKRRALASLSKRM